MKKQEWSYGVIRFYLHLRNLLQQTQLSFDQFIENLHPSTKNQLNKVQFFRIFSCLDMKDIEAFAALDIFFQISQRTESIKIAYFEKQFRSCCEKYPKEFKGGQFKEQPKQVNQKDIQMKKHMIRVSLHKLNAFVNKLEDPLEMFHSFDVDDSGNLSKKQFNQFLLATEIKELAQKEIRREVIHLIYKSYKPKEEMSEKQYALLFKIPYDKFKKIVNPPAVSPPQAPIVSSPAKHVFLNVPNEIKHNSLEQKHHEQNDLLNPVRPFKKKAQNQVQSNNPLNHLFEKNKIIYNEPHVKKADSNNTFHFPSNKASQEKQEKQTYFDTLSRMFPDSIKYYRLGGPTLDEHSYFQQLEMLLKKGIVFKDNDNPKVKDGAYVYPNQFFNGRYSIFQVAQSVLFREKSRIGIARAIEPKDIIQGEAGDCYFLSSIASIISIYPQLISERFLFEVNPSHYYCCKLFIDGQWKIIKSDDQFACKNGNKPVYAKPHTNQIWVMMLEKCWAKVYGSYQNIESGSSKEGFLALTGAPSEIINIDNEKETSQTILLQLKKAQEKRYVASISGSKYLESLSSAQQDKLGLISNHAYSFLKILNLPNKETLVKIRNPWGKTIWQGEWSFSSNKWTKQLRQKYNYTKSPEDGSFYMSWTSFAKYFGEMVICKLNPTFSHTSIKVKSSKKKSQYFQMEVKEAGQYIISIYQESKRKFKNSYQNYGYSNGRVIILKKQQNGKLKYVGAKVSNQAQICSFDGEFTEGTYILSAKVQWKFWPDHQFCLTSYGPDKVQFQKIQRNIAPFFKKELIRSYALQNEGKKKSYDKYGIDAYNEFSVSLQTGIGFLRVVNKSKKWFESTYSMQLKNMKVIKPDKLPFVFNMNENTQYLVGFFVSASGYQYSSAEKIKYNG